MRATKQENIGHISGKVNEGDKIKKQKLLTSLKKVTEGDEKNKQKKHSRKNIFYLSK